LSPIPIKISTGSEPIDRLLDGGLGAGEMLLVFGERGAGKTSLSFQAVAASAVRGARSAMLYSDGRIPMERLIEISGPSWSAICELVSFLEVKSFSEQEAVIEDLSRQMAPRTALLVIDSITARYSAELGEAKENVTVNKALNWQLALLRDLCKRTGLAVILTSEVRAKPDGQGVQPAASAILTYWADKIVLLEKVHSDLRRAVLFRAGAPSKPKREALMRMTGRGLVGIVTGTGTGTGTGGGVGVGIGGANGA